MEENEITMNDCIVKREKEKHGENEEVGGEEEQDTNLSVNPILSLLIHNKERIRNERLGREGEKSKEVN